MDNKQFRGERLKSARLFRGMTLTELADATGISKQSLSLYENNGNKPEYDRVFILSRALDFPREYFLQEDKCKTETEVTYFRSLTSATKMSRTSQSIKLEYVAKMYEVLEKYLDFPLLNLPSVDFVENDDEFNDDAEDKMLDEVETIALLVRDKWGVVEGPLKNLQFVLEKNGIIVTGFDTSDVKIDAFSQRTILDNREVYFIAVSQGTAPECRIRFDMAHELGHILLHPWSESLDLIEKDEFKRREKQANMFASALLLPKKTFLQDVSAYPTDLQYYQFLKKKWNCSIQSMIYRSHQLKAITDNQYQYMMRQVSKNGWRQKEPGDVPYFINENIFQGAIDLLINEAKVLTAASLLRSFEQYGVTLYPGDIEELLHLREGTLTVEEEKPKIVALKRT
jgi:hypothetical protein